MPTDDPAPHLCLAGCGADADEDSEYCSRKCGVGEALKRLTAAEISSPSILAVARAPSSVSEREGFSQWDGSTIEPLVETLDMMESSKRPDTTVTAASSVFPTEPHAFKYNEGNPISATAPPNVINRASPLGRRNCTISHLERHVYEDHPPLMFERPSPQDNSIASKGSLKPYLCIATDNERFQTSRTSLLEEDASIVGSEERESVILSRQHDQGFPSSVDRWDSYEARPRRTTEIGVHRVFSGARRFITTVNAPSNTPRHRAGGSSMLHLQHMPSLSRIISLFRRRRVVTTRFSGCLPSVVDISPMYPSISSVSPCSSTSALLSDVTISLNSPSLSTVSCPAIKTVRHAPLDVPTSPTTSLSSFKVCSAENTVAPDTGPGVRFVLTGRGERGGIPVSPENCCNLNAGTEHSFVAPGQPVYLNAHEEWSGVALPRHATRDFIPDHRALPDQPRLGGIGITSEVTVI